MIGGSILYRECLANSIGARRPDWIAIAASGIAEWLKTAPHQSNPAAILCCTGDGRVVRAQLALLSALRDSPPVVVLAELENFKHLVVDLLYRLRGYVPSDATLDIVVEALDIVRRGGVFLPASLSSPNGMLQDPPMLAGGSAAFTAREHAVLRALRQGKSNKCIAYDLKMSESTVKVHVRNIMKKLRARNRTEVAFLTHYLFSASNDAFMRPGEYVHCRGEPL